MLRKEHQNESFFHIFSDFTDAIRFFRTPQYALLSLMHTGSRHNFGTLFSSLESQDNEESYCEYAVSPLSYLFRVRD